MDQPILLGDEPGIQRTGCPPCNHNCHQAHDCPLYKREPVLDGFWARIRKAAAGRGLDWWPAQGLAYIALGLVILCYLVALALPVPR
jgi:hypothetical protein